MCPPPLPPMEEFSNVYRKDQEQKLTKFVPLPTPHGPIFTRIPKLSITKTDKSVHCLKRLQPARKYQAYKESNGLK